ncbi:MAG: hypothetical protein JWM77_1498 [Rhodospirillales bacterium]|nr:hypothetical protein [Rhodospirillales bacterium]
MTQRRAPSVVDFATQQDRLQQQLARFNRARLSPSLPEPSWREAIREEARLRMLEGEYVEHERAQIEPMLSDMPQQVDSFMRWFEALEANGPGQQDRLFPWLAEQATREQMCWFLVQEVAGEAGFDDLVAMTQVKLPTQPKLELARNYWDEMGRGQAKGMHGPMLGRLATELGLVPTIEHTVWESLSLANLMCAFATNRRYAYHSVGALGAIELTAPGRAALVGAGLKRLGIGLDARQYFELHAVLDVKHSAAWNEEAIRPLVAADPRLARPIAEGALMRLRAGQRCFDRYRRAFGLV